MSGPHTYISATTKLAIGSNKQPRVYAFRINRQLIPNNTVDCKHISKHPCLTNLTAMHVFGVTVGAKHTATRYVTVDAHDAMRLYAVTQQAARGIKLIAVFTVFWTLDLNQ